MPKFNGKFLSGVLGPVKLSVRKGKQIMSRSVVPGTMKQTVATKVASTVFGKASSLSKRLRMSLSPHYPGLFDNAVINRINGILYPILKDCKDPDSGLYNYEQNSFTRLDYLEFNHHSMVSRMMSQKPVMTLEGTVFRASVTEQRVPKDFKFPPGSLSCELIFGLSLFRLADGFALRTAEFNRITVSVKDKLIAAQVIDFNVPAGCLCVVTLFLNYSTFREGAWTLMKDRKFSPAMICGAVHTSGMFVDDGSRYWGITDKV